MVNNLTKSAFWGLRSLAGSLPHHATNGGSKLGSLDWPPLPPFLPSHVSTITLAGNLSLKNCSRCLAAGHGAGWVQETLVQQRYLIQVRSQTIPLDQCILTSLGVTRYYDWTVSRGSLAPDGVSLDVMLVNGEFPGPLIEANWGDW